MRSAIDTALKVAVIVCLVLVATSVSYYYVLYLPDRDAAIEQSRRAETARTKAEADRAAAADAAAKKDAAFVEDLRKGRVQSRYELCTLSAEKNYSGTWDSNCVRLESLRQKNYKDCLSTPSFSKQLCDQTHGDVRPAIDCSLPKAMAESLNEQLERGRASCFREFQAGLE